MTKRIILSLFVFFIFGAFCSVSAATKTYLDCYIPSPEGGPPLCASIEVPDDCVQENQDFSITVDGSVERFPPYGGEISMFEFYEGATWDYQYYDYNTKMVNINSGTLLDREGFIFGAGYNNTYTQNKPAGFHKYSFLFGYRTDVHQWYDVAVDAYVTVGSGTSSTINFPLDIHPGGCPNPLSTKNAGVLPVAIVGTSSFDVTTVDLSSILLEGVAPLDSAEQDVATPYNPYTGKQLENDCTLAGADGINDLILHFDANAVVLSIEKRLGRLVVDNEILILSLTATLQNDPCTTLYGEDVVRIEDNGNDFDGDGYVKGGVNGDCDDRSPFVHPNALEVCDGVDNDCDGIIDPMPKATYYKDNDGDGYGDPLNSAEACWEHPDYSTNNLDCDDRRDGADGIPGNADDGANINSNVFEECFDGLDNDCDAVTRDDCMLNRDVSLTYTRGSACEEVAVSIEIEPASVYDGPYTCDFDWGDGSAIEQSVSCDTTHVYTLPGRILYDINWSVRNVYGFVLNDPAPSVDTVSICRPAVLLNASHDKSNNIGCSDCHVTALPATGRSAVCSTAACHGVGSPLPHADHSNAVIHGGQTGPYGNWSTECIDCHNPHLQEQLGRVTTYFDQLFLLTGKIDTITTQGTTTTVTYTDLTVHDQTWNDPATWEAKDGVGRGLIFVPNANGPQETFEIVSATANSITLNGLMDDVLIAALTHYSAHPMQFGIIYGQFIKSKINEREAVFFGNTTFANNDGLGDGQGDTDIDNDGVDDDSTPDGICQVCHILTLYWRADGTKSNHYSGQNCSTCHDPVQGFKVTP